MDDTEYAAKVQHLKQTIKNSDTLSFTADSVEDIDKFGDLGIKLEGPGYKITDTLHDLAEHGIILTYYFPDIDNIAYFSALEAEKKTVEKTVETTETRGKLHHNTPETP